MESQNTLSPQQYLFLTSQDTLLPPNFNKSENLKRIQREVHKMFETFKIILGSEKLNQSYRNKLFSSYNMYEFLRLLVSYDRTTPLRDENNKLEIASHIIKIGFSYYQSRFRKTAFLQSKINEISGFLTSLNEFVTAETDEEEAMNFYRMRKHMKKPPEIYGSKDMWYSVCMICWRYSNGKTKENAMKSIKHEKNCTYDRKRLEQCTKNIPPNSGEVK